MMEVVLEWKLLMFQEATYLQKVGVAIGIHLAQNYSDIFMARKIYKNILKLIDTLRSTESKSIVAQLIILKVFLDDLFPIVMETIKQIHELH